jgi:hypothetical protein
MKNIWKDPKWIRIMFPILLAIVIIMILAMIFQWDFGEIWRF